MVDEKLTLEGLFSIVLYGKIIVNEQGERQYVFQTFSDGADTCKTPMGMFNEDYIVNDLQLVKEALLNLKNK